MLRLLPRALARRLPACHASMLRSALAASYRTPHHARLETLEARHMMAAAPVAVNDSAYYSALNTDLVVTTSSNPGRLTANDIDIDGNSLTASVVAGPTSGSLIAFASDGTFTYRPNTGFVGVDSFTYKVNDGSLDSNIAMVSIAVGTHLLARQDLQPLHVSVASGPDVRTGDMVFAESLNNDQTLVSSGDSLVRPVIAVDTQLASGVGVPSSITAQLTFNGTAGTTYSYDTSGLTSGQSLHFALQANGSSLATGVYDYSLSIVTTISGVAKTQVFTGKQAIVNRSTSVFGSGWWLDGLDQIVDSSAGALLVRGDSSSLWFAKSGSTYQSAAGDDSFNTLVKNTGNTFTVTSKSGIVSSFSTSGLLTSVVDTNGNTLSYAYADRNSDGIASELISITDPFSRVTNVNYTSGYVSSIVHFSGRTTTLSISAGVLSSYALPDPDGAGSLTSPTFSFGYSGSLISSRTDAASKVTSFSYDTTDGRLRTITHPDSSTWQLLPADTVGLPTGTTGNAIQTSSDVQAQITDERSGVWKLRTDRFGLITESITALGFTSTILRNADGLPVMITEPDPDGTGPLTSSVTKYGYNSAGDLTHSLAPDGGLVTATYSSGLHQVLSTVDPVGRTQSFTYDSSGNLLTSTDGAGYVTNYVYNSRGLTTSVTPPDPDGSGSLTSPVTSFAYDSYGRLVTVTNPDSSTRTFTYNSADQILTSVDELGKTDSVTYDSLGRPISNTNRVSATTSVTYDAMSRMLSQTDALGNVTYRRLLRREATQSREAPACYSLGC